MILVKFLMVLGLYVKFGRAQTQAPVCKIEKTGMESYRNQTQRATGQFVSIFLIEIELKTAETGDVID